MGFNRQGNISEQVQFLGYKLVQMQGIDAHILGNVLRLDRFRAENQLEGTYENTVALINNPGLRNALSVDKGSVGGVQILNNIGAARFLAAKFPTDNGETLEADEKVADLGQQLVSVRREIDVLDNKELALQNAIKDEMGPATIVQGPGFRVTWKWVKGSTYTVTRAAGRRFLISEREVET
jgi:hypothetical protein